MTRPHASIPHNPLLAEPLFLAGYIEQAGTGTLDMIALSREAGLKTPGFRQDGGSFVQTLWRPVPVATGQVAGQVTPQLTPQVTPQLKKPDDRHLEQLAAALAIPTPQVTPQVTTQVEKVLQAAVTAQSREGLQQAVALTDRKHFRESLLNPLIEAGWLALTIPETPSSRLQKYYLTDKGRAWLTTQAGASAP